MSPDANSIVRRGSFVDVTADVEYTVASAPNGLLVLYAQDAAGVYQRWRHAAVTRGTGRATLGASIAVPDRESMWVIVTLYVGGRTSERLSSGGLYRIQ